MNELENSDSFGYELEPMSQEDIDECLLSGSTFLKV